MTACGSAGMFPHRSLTSDWLKRTWKPWRDWTASGKLACWMSKSTHCGHSKGQMIKNSINYFYNFSPSIKSHPYYPFVWGGLKMRGGLSSWLTTSNDPAATALPPNRMLQHWQLLVHDSSFFFVNRCENFQKWRMFDHQCMMVNTNQSTRKPEHVPLQVNLHTCRNK